MVLKISQILMSNVNPVTMTLALISLVFKNSLNSISNQTFRGLPYSPAGSGGEMKAIIMTFTIRREMEADVAITAGGG